jgi:hypothetical protein
MAMKDLDKAVVAEIHAIAAMIAARELAAWMAGCEAAAKLVENWSPKVAAQIRMLHP